MLVELLFCLQVLLIYWSFTFTAALWHIWKGRNDVYFNQSHFFPLDVYRQTLAYASDMQVQLAEVHGMVVRRPTEGSAASYHRIELIRGS